jgi:hypothetical protein
MWSCDHAVEGHRAELRHGVVVYVSGDTGPPRLPGETLEKSLEDPVKIPFTQKICIRPNWREVQNKPGKLDFPDWWQSRTWTP